MKLRVFDINRKSKIKCELSIDEEFKIIYCKFSGIYEIGSKGNMDGLFIFSKICSVYFLFDTIAVIILDLKELNYSFGNTLLKSLNFFEEIGRDKEEKEKEIIIIVSEQNQMSIGEVMKMLTKNRVKVHHDYSEAINEAIIFAENDIMD
ncbi:hypothetical protein AAEO56_11685 [Flavobacterium sp. DGU11]|uniref:STAS domain-containing protein n=1 Tax=Flavobacterium arundinis TaxID=3139143 RepID=A0ABU9HZE3_9FLAO